jgi:hypothetical protein
MFLAGLGEAIPNMVLLSASDGLPLEIGLGGGRDTAKGVSLRLAAASGADGGATPNRVFCEAWAPLPKFFPVLGQIRRPATWSCPQ